MSSLRSLAKRLFAPFRMTRKQHGNTPFSVCKTTRRSTSHLDLIPWGLVLAGTCGCVVTDDASLEVQPNYPPTIYTQDREEHIRVINLDSDPDGALSFPPMQIGDPNVDQTLQYAVFLDRAPTDPLSAVVELLEQGDIPPNPEREFQRRLTIRPILNDVFTPGCHKVEVFVSGELLLSVDEGLRWVPLIEGDIDRVAWWVASQDSETPSVSLEGCPK